MKIIGIPALVGTYDNYIWVLHNQKSAWVVDPGESKQIIEFLKSHKLNLEAILITHNHFDHVNGIFKIKQQFPAAHVYGSEKTPHSSIQTRLKENDIINLAEGLFFKILETPGHTVDHITYYNDQWLFCGDTLFSGGCGRELGGGYKAFANSILKISNLPDSLEFYCGHEYTKENLTFALWIDSENTILQQRYNQLDIDYPKTLKKPQSTLGIEKKTNPFIRFEDKAILSQLIKRGANKSSPESLFKTLRNWKDDIDKNGFPP